MLYVSNAHVCMDARVFNKSSALDKDHRISVVRMPLQYEMWSH